MELPPLDKEVEGLVRLVGGLVAWLICLLFVWCLVDLRPKMVFEKDFLILSDFVVGMEWNRRGERIDDNSIEQLIFKLLGRILGAK